MVKLFCDGCQVDTTEGLNSEFRLTFRDKKGTLLGKKEEIKTGIIILCEQCSLAVKNFVASLKK